MLKEAFDFIFRTLTDPERLIQLLSTGLSGWYGYLLLFAIVFAETGLLVGFLLPGDSLMFTVGVVAGAGQLNLFWINIVLIAAAVIGDALGYYLGKTSGPRIFSRPNSRLFRREYLRKTQEFYNRHGGKTIVYARFVPIIRTFAPFVAGVAGMPYSRFLSFNIFGGIGWVVSLTLLGYGLGKVEFVREHFEKFVLGIVFLSVIPVAKELWVIWRNPEEVPEP